MPMARTFIPANQAGGMNDRTRTVVAQLGMHRELRNIDTSEGMWQRRMGHGRANKAACPWGTAIGAVAYKDSNQNVHAIVVGSNSTIWHSLNYGVSFGLCVMHTTCTWDATYQATFAPWKDDCFIAIGSVNGSGKNLRFRGIDQHIVGVSLDAPTTAPTVALGAVATAAISGTLGAYLPAPASAPTTAKGVVDGSMPTGAFQYIVTYADVTDYANIIESPGGPASNGNTAVLWGSDPRSVDLAAIPLCPGGVIPLGHTIYRNLYRRDLNIVVGGWGSWQFLHTIEDNTAAAYWDSAPDTGIAPATQNLATVGTGTHKYRTRYVDVTDPDQEFIGDASAASADFTNDVASAITLSGLAPYPGTGRIIEREIFRFDTGNSGYYLVARIAGNLTTYTDTTNDVSGNEALVEHIPVPVCKNVAVMPNGVAVWANDVTQSLPAALYFALDDTTPESLVDGLPMTIGNHAIPVTGLYSVRDGVVAGKQNVGGLYFISKECEVCERILSGVGVTAWATFQSRGEEIVFLSPVGPRITAHDLQSQVAFVGDERYAFALAGTWKSVIRTRLPYACSVHDTVRGWMAWFVQSCPESPCLDLAIIWDYASRTAQFPMGILHVQDIAIEAAFAMPGDSPDETEPWGVFHGGFVGRLWDGNHPDFMSEWPPVAQADMVVSVNGNQVTLDDSAWDFDPVGMTLWVWEGAGSPDVLLPCGRAKALITANAGVSGIGSTYELVGELPLDGTSRFTLGGWNTAIDIDGLDGGDPARVKMMARADVNIEAVDR